MLIELGLTEALAGFIVSAQYIATIISRPQAGRISDIS